MVYVFHQITCKVVNVFIKALFDNESVIIDYEGFAIIAPPGMKKCSTNIFATINQAMQTENFRPALQCLIRAF